MELCKRCVFTERDCSPEAKHIVESEGVCNDFRPHKVNCSRCKQEVVHGSRRTLICLDCLIELLDESGAIETHRKDWVRLNGK